MAHELPHDAYITEVAEAFRLHDITVIKADTSSPDGELLEAWIEFDTADIDPDTWPNGVYLGWDHHRGWHLIEAGGGRNITDLDPEAVLLYGNPRQVAASTANALAGQMVTGPIRNDGTWSWTAQPVMDAVAAWEAEQ